MKTFPDKILPASKFIWKNGYNLIEVMIALGVVAVALPISMALIVATSNTTHIAEKETRGTFIAREVFEELRHARDGQGKHITKKLTWPDFPGGDSWIVLYADSNGKIIGEASSADYKDGIKGKNAAYLLAVRGEAYDELEKIIGTSGNEEHNEIKLSRVELRIETPAVANEESRNSQRKPLKFVQLMSASD